jgi:hypothetical protein
MLVANTPNRWVSQIRSSALSFFDVTGYRAPRSNQGSSYPSRLSRAESRTDSRPRTEECNLRTCGVMGQQ